MIQKINIQTQPVLPHPCTTLGQHLPSFLGGSSSPEVCGAGVGRRDVEGWGLGWAGLRLVNTRHVAVQ